MNYAYPSARMFQLSNNCTFYTKFCMNFIMYEVTDPCFSAIGNRNLGGSGCYEVRETEVPVPNIVTVVPSNEESV
jgi:hypothetical protein